ncbi:ATP-binding cassette sub-family A member 2-like, partial [Rhincodon typus]|uniref:ATP-binding cassette sub-family A member 2-like n=1 Tax=Rhincodon typus TaxID=259920 RepID=UPI002030131C
MGTELGFRPLLSVSVLLCVPKSTLEDVYLFRAEVAGIGHERTASWLRDKIATHWAAADKPGNGNQLEMTDSRAQETTSLGSCCKFTSDLKKHPEVLNASDSDIIRNFINSNFSMPNSSTLLQQLDTIDNAACGWIQFMSKVSVDIFKGFPNEESIVNYTLSQAYQDNVTVFA